jgi:hypothetical protein
MSVASLKFRIVIKIDNIKNFNIMNHGGGTGFLYTYVLYINRSSSQSNDDFLNPGPMFSIPLTSL